MRFIPGFAGNAPFEIIAKVIGAVYPRLRGERHYRDEPTLSAGGLSPASRGTRAKSPWR